MTITYEGDSRMTTSDRSGLATVCVGTGTVTPGNNNIKPVVVTIMCSFEDATAPTVYDIQVEQEANSAGLDSLFSYTVDFQVDGNTVPELSGEMQPVVGSSGVNVLSGQRNFRFTNSGMRNIAVDTELDPARSDMFLAFELVTPASPVDQFALTTAGDLPLDITGAARIVCAAEENAMAFPDTRFGCPIYGDENKGVAEYRFYLAVKRPNQSTSPLSSFDINLLSNGVEIPGGPVYTGTQDSAFFQTFLIRSDSSDGPIILLDDSPPFVLKVTFEATGDFVALAATPPAGGFCDTSNTFTGTTGMTYNVIISCRDYVAGDYQFNVGTPGAISGAVYDFFYDGVLQTALSGTGDIPSTGGRSFRFTAPATRGDALTMNGAGDPFVNPAF